MELKDVVKEGSIVLVGITDASYIVQRLVQEVSPSGKYIKFDNTWYCVSNLKTLEVLEADGE